MKSTGIWNSSIFFSHFETLWPQVGYLAAWSLSSLTLRGGQKYCLPHRVLMVKRDNACDTSCSARHLVRAPPVVALTSITFP